MADDTIYEKNMDQVLRNPELINRIVNSVQEKSLFLNSSALDTQKFTVSNRGVAMPIANTSAFAGYVGEGEVKPTDNVAFGSAQLIPKKLAVILTWSQEANDDYAGLAEFLLNEATNALYRAFDYMVITGLSLKTGQPIPGATGLNTAITNTVKWDPKNILGTLRQADALVDDGGYTLVSAGLDTSLAGDIASAVTPTGVPIYSQDGSLIRNIQNVNGIRVDYSRAFTGRFPKRKAKESGILGTLGDFSQLAVGMAKTVDIQMFDNTYVTGVGGTMEKNLLALRAEMSAGHVVLDKNAFVNILPDTPPAEGKK
jgi:hypothetical protein